MWDNRYVYMHSFSSIRMNSIQFHFLKLCNPIHIFVYMHLWILKKTSVQKKSALVNIRTTAQRVFESNQEDSRIYVLPYLVFSPFDRTTPTLSIRKQNLFLIKLNQIDWGLNMKAFQSDRAINLITYSFGCM